MTYFSSSKIPFLGHSILLYLAASFCILFFYAGLPYDFSADFPSDYRVVQNARYSQLLLYLIHPTTPAWFFYGKMEELRPVTYTLHKIWHDLFDMNLVPVHIVVSAAHGVLAVTYFHLAQWITKNKWVGWFVAILYASFPSNTVLLAGYLSLEINLLQAALTLGAMVSLIALTWKKEISLPGLAGLIAFWIFVTLLDINWKSSDKILPFVYFGFLTLRFKVIHRQVGPWRWLTLLLLNLFMFIMVFPFPASHSSIPEKSILNESREVQPLKDVQFLNKEKRATRFKISNIMARTFALPGRENPLLHPSLEEHPKTFTANLGFYLGWFFWIGLACFPFYFGEVSRSAADFDRDLRLHAMILNLLWFGAILAGFSMDQDLEEMRYLNFALIPGALLFAFLIWIFQQKTTAHPLSKILTATFIALSAYALTQNFGFITKWVSLMGGYQHANHEARRSIYQSFYGVEPAGAELYQRFSELEDRVVHSSWYHRPENWPEKLKEKLHRERVFYLNFRTEGENPSDGRDYEALQIVKSEQAKIEKLGTFYYGDASPLFFKFITWLEDKGLRPKKDWRIVVYKATLPEISQPSR